MGIVGAPGKRIAAWGWGGAAGRCSGLGPRGCCWPRCICKTALVAPSKALARLLLCFGPLEASAASGVPPQSMGRGHVCSRRSRVFEVLGATPGTSTYRAAYPPACRERACQGHLASLPASVPITLVPSSAPVWVRCAFLDSFPVDTTMRSSPSPLPRGLRPLRPPVLNPRTWTGTVPGCLPSQPREGPVGLETWRPAFASPPTPALLHLLMGEERFLNPRR